MPVSVSVDVVGFQKALGAYAGATKKSMPKVVNKAGQYLTSFAIAKVPVANAGRIESELMRKGTSFTKLRFTKKGTLRKRQKPSSKQAVANTLAASIVAARLRRAGKKIPDKGQMALKIRAMVRARKGAAGYHRSGFFPALKEFRARKGANRFKVTARPAGFAKSAKATETIPEAIIANTAKSIGTVAPNALRDSLPEVSRLFTSWTHQALKDARRKNIG